MDLGDGGAADGRRLVHVYDEPGIYTARVTVRSPVGTEGRGTVSVIVGLTFEDLGDTIFAKEIAWLSATGITLGCESRNLRFCPQLGFAAQMASFLTAPSTYLPGRTPSATTRARPTRTPSTPSPPPPSPRDAPPPACPDEEVSRAQMASLDARLDRPPDAFGDDEGSTHEDAINALAATGITQGCTTTNFVRRRR